MSTSAKAIWSILSLGIIVIITACTNATPTPQPTATPTPRPTPTATPIPTPTMPPQQELSDLREDLTTGPTPVFTAIDRCYEEMGGSPGISRQLAAVDGLELVSGDITGDMTVELGSGLNSRQLVILPGASSEAREIYDATDDANDALRLKNLAMTRLAASLRGQGFEVPPDPEGRDGKIIEVLREQDLSDAVWIAIREDVHSVIAKEDALNARLLAVYQLLSPNCGTTP